MDFATIFESITNPELNIFGSVNKSV